MMYYSSSDEEPELETLDISNDQYYRPVAPPTPKLCNLRTKEALVVPKYGSKTILHSLPATDLWKPFFPTYLSEGKFRNFHRPKLRHYNTGPQAGTRRGYYSEQPIKSLSRHIFRCQKKLAEKVITAINNGIPVDEIKNKLLLIREAKDLSAKSGELFLFEYCEEHPTVLGQIGMASNIKTYSYEPAQKTVIKRAKVPPSNGTNGNPSVNGQAKPITAQTQGQTETRFGYSERVISDNHAKRIYFNQLKPGSKVQMIENNLYRAPIFEHTVSDCDFIVIRTRNSFYIRPVKTIFAVGQTLPLTQVLSPTESYIQKFRCELSNVYIHKLFQASDTKPPSIKLDVLCRLFPDYHRSVLQKRLTHSGARKAMMDRESVMIQADSNYGKIPLAEIRRMMRPEHYCMNMSMLAARQRLRELNYTESMIYPPKEVLELEPEVLAAPWNTTKAVMSAMRGQAYLDLEKHLIDPTGPIHEGFSCVAWVKSPTEEQQNKEINGDGANGQSDRSRVPLPLEKNPLRGKITQEKLKRLAVFQNKAQHIAEIQAKILSNTTPDSSSEDECDADDEIENCSDGEFEQQLEDLSRLVIGGRSVSELNHEKEEEERHKMLSEFKMSEMANREADRSTQNGAAKRNSGEFSRAALQNKVLIITRTYDYEGRKIQRVEVVREPRIIALYVKQKGGTLTASLNESNLHLGSGDQHNASMMSTRSDGHLSQNRIRPRSSSLGPSELCRADGTRLTISKKVLEKCRPMRQCRR